jgi:hypothetical protein
MNPDYIRVIPRDLFNEAKLLKCVGRLCLLIHDGATPFPMEIALMDEGALTITNLVVIVNGEAYRVKTTYNSKAAYPLFMEVDGDEVEVFTEHGDFSDEFKAAFT